MQELTVWLQENWPLLVGSGGITGVITYIFIHLTKKTLPSFLGKVAYAFAKVISNLFGSSYDGSESIASEIPLVNEIRTQLSKLGDKYEDRLKSVEESVEVDYAFKLIELKQKLSSPLYTAVEKIPLQSAFNYLFDKVKHKLPKEVIDALKVIDEIKG